MPTHLFWFISFATNLPLLLKVEHYEYNLQIGEKIIITTIIIITTSICNTLTYKIKY
jgi:hypothetical protein